MTDPRSASPRQPSPEELRAYLEELRDADAAGLLAEAYNLLAAGAQVKLGRPDARPLIDAMAGITQAGTAALPDEIAKQMQQGVAQLQVAQVEAEREGAGQGRQPEQPATAGGEKGEAAQAPPRPGEQESKVTDRLWVPGRGPGLGGR